MIFTQKHQQVYGYFIEINPLKVESCISNLSRIRTVLSAKHSWRIPFSKFQEIFLFFVLTAVSSCSFMSTNIFKNLLEQILCSSRQEEKCFNRTRAKLLPRIAVKIK